MLEMLTSMFETQRSSISWLPQKSRGQSKPPTASPEQNWKEENVKVDSAKCGGNEIAPKSLENGIVY